jgi:tRNA(His) 5'-end guanylyltransferase
MPINDELGKRMKENYEKRARTYLTRRTPVAIRIDGKAFHTFTKGFNKPFDEILVATMQRTMKYLCENIQGAVFGYCQSDEITIILQDYATLTTDAWFDYQVQKMCSVAASMATMAFNRVFWDEYNKWYLCSNISSYPVSEEIKKLNDIYGTAAEAGAMFDARCFNIPKEEVCNLIYWRQIDATRNSIQMVGQANFSHDELQNKTCNDIQDMLMTQKGINWNNFPTHLKRGSACIKEEYYAGEIAPGCEDCPIDPSCLRTRWIIDTEMPILKGENRKYVDNLIYIGE